VPHLHQRHSCHGAGVAAFPLLSNTTAVQASAVPDNEILSGSSRAEVVHQVPLTFQGDKIGWHGFDRYDFVMDKQGVNAIPQIVEQQRRQALARLRAFAHSPFFFDFEPERGKAKT
jgi:hypothetical protein